MDVLQNHPFLVADSTKDVDMVGWVASAVEFRDRKMRQAAEAPPEPPQAQ